MLIQQWGMAVVAVGAVLVVLRIIPLSRILGRRRRALGRLGLIVAGVGAAMVMVPLIAGLLLQALTHGPS